MPVAADCSRPLVDKCKRLGRAMRIGTNHGSLSARILSYYGDTPRGMVESRVRVCGHLPGRRLPQLPVLHEGQQPARHGPGAAPAKGSLEDP